MRRAITVATLAAIGVAASAQADTTDVQWQNRVVVEKQGVHCVDDPNCFNRYHPAIEPAARAQPGDFIVFETRDALDTDLTLESNADDVAALDLNLVRPMTGPVRIEGASRGDVLAVTLIDIEPDQFGYTIVVPGFGFLRDMFTEPVFVGWQLSRTHAVSDQMPGVRVPMAAFMGSVGVLPGEEEVAAWLEREAQAATRTSACAPFRRARTAATWTCSRCRSAPRCSCPASSTAAGCSWATCITRRATARSRARPSRWVRW
jgi:formamidase